MTDHESPLERELRLQAQLTLWAQNPDADVDGAIVQEIAELDAEFYRIAGHWPARPYVDTELLTRAREIAQHLLDEEQE